MRILTFLLLIVSSIGASSQPLSGDSWGQVKSRRQGTITIAYTETPGFAYRDEYGVLRGISVDIMKDFVRYVSFTKNVELTYTTVGDGSDFEGMYQDVKNSVGGVFGLGNITITEARKKEVKFSPPYIANYAMLITQNSVPMLTSLTELPTRFNNLTAYTAKGTLNDQRILDLKQRYFAQMKVAYTASSQEALEKVSADPKGFAYVDLPFYLQAIQDGKSIRRHSIADRSAEKFGFIMPLNSDWNILLDEFFSANGGYTNSPQYKAILKNHLGETGVMLLQSAAK